MHFQVPFILVGQLISAVGTGLLLTLSPTTPTILWATYMVLAGWGTGMGENTPYIAIQAAIDEYTTLTHSRICFDNRKHSINIERHSSLQLTLLG